MSTSSITYSYGALIGLHVEGDRLFFEGTEYKLVDEKRNGHPMYQHMQEQPDGSLKLNQILYHPLPELKKAGIITYIQADDGILPDRVLPGFAVLHDHEHVQ